MKAEEMRENWMECVTAANDKMRDDELHDAEVVLAQAHRWRIAAETCERLDRIIELMELEGE